MTQHTFQECLQSIGVDTNALQNCDNVDEEFKVLKKQYYVRILQTHPDKGGDPDEFRKVQTAFEVLRELYAQGRVGTFVTEATAEHYEDAWKDFGDMPTPSWEYYQEAAEEEMPGYRVEPAKSGRSKCTQKGKTAKKCQDEWIPKGDLRVGSLDDMNGGYGRWHHLMCWRVPSRIWLGFPKECTDRAVFQHALEGMNEVLLSGVNELTKEQWEVFLEHVMNRENWARLTKRKPRGAAPSEDSIPDQAVSSAQETNIVVQNVRRDVFVPPVPGQNGAAENALEGKTVVLTGVFPEVGGGKGLSLGKARVKKIVQSFGGRVTSAISGKTDILVVGKNPGFSKVTQARTRGVQLVTLKDMKEGLEGGMLENAETPVISEFSAGYMNNGTAKIKSASKEEFEFAAGIGTKTIKDEPAELARKKPAGRKRSATSRKKASTSTARRSKRARQR